MHTSLDLVQERVGNHSARPSCSLQDSCCRVTWVSWCSDRAIENGKPKTKGLIHHSDRVCEFTSDWFQNISRTIKITCYMSRTGCCYDNAIAEQFFWLLKHEWTKFEKYANLEDAKISVFKYIETFYISERIHQTLQYLSPVEFETQYHAALAI